MGDGRATQVRIRVALIDDRGQELEAVEVDLTPAVIGVGESSGFEAVLATTDPGTIKLELSWIS